MATIAVNVAVIQNGKILLTKRDDFEVWCLPSGGVEPGESVAQAAIRETREETGLEVQLTRLIGIYSKLGPWDEIHAVLFIAKPIGGELRTQIGETVEVRYFGPKEIPNELLYGQRQRILDALSDIKNAVTRLQKLSPPLSKSKRDKNSTKCATNQDWRGNSFTCNILNSAIQKRTYWRWAESEHVSGLTPKPVMAIYRTAQSRQKETTF